ncbi:uncharacterized protein LOC130932547 [Arachis stenosperma]|uniref:uncharacterized protein LOC130932547 n=1 Tax=Arachis stenosperma TaxID=217475 RepID=UPI0025AC6A3E|nr:uncharacterized protein LOC130932547 [Arachis stenosperma]
MRMEGERRKRKLESSEEEEKEENEEQKMETFFALVKSTKEARDLLFNKDKTDNKVDEDEEALKKGKATWIPMFQPEDFIDYGELGRRSSHNNNNNNNNSNNNVPTTTPHASGAGPSEKQKEEVVVMEKQHLQEAAAATLEAPIPEINEQKEKTSDLLDLNLSL